MRIDFEELPRTSNEHFKGGDGVTNIRAFNDEINRIMKVTLERGSSIGLHKHENNSEIVFIISGKTKTYKPKRNAFQTKKGIGIQHEEKTPQPCTCRRYGVLVAGAYRLQAGFKRGRQARKRRTHHKRSHQYLQGGFHQYGGHNL